jgi:hypothetical protein
VSSRGFLPVLDLDVGSVVPSPLELSADGPAHVLLRLHGRPIAVAGGSLQRGRLELDSLIKHILESHAGALASPLVGRALALGSPPGWPEVPQLLECPPAGPACLPPVTVAIRPSGRSAARRACLEAVGRLAYPGVEVVTLDTNPAAPVDAMLQQCRGEVLVVVDDDVELDARWIEAAVRVFVADPEVMAVVGLVLPRVSRAPLGRILRRRWHRGPGVTMRGGGEALPLAAAFWRSALEDAPGDAAASGLSVASSSTAASDVAPGVPVASGFSRKILQLLLSGHTVVYEPAAVAWHRTRLAADPFVDSPCSPGVAAGRCIDLGDTPRSIADAGGSDRLRLDVAWDGRDVGRVEIPHRGAVVTPFRIQDAVAEELAWQALDTRLGVGEPALRSIVTSELARHLLARRGAAAPGAGRSRRRAPRSAAA